MEVKDWLYIASFLITVIASYFKLQTAIDIVKNDLKNHREAHSKLEDRVASHEEKIDDKLDMMNSKIDELKDLIIERIK